MSRRGAQRSHKKDKGHKRGSVPPKTQPNAPKPPEVSPENQSNSEIAVQEITPKPANDVPPTEEKKERKPVKYIWPESLQGRRFIIRVTVVAVISISIAGLAQILFGSFASAAALAILGAVASLIINHVERGLGSEYKLALPWTPESWFGIAFLAIVIFQSIQLLVNLWLIPWRILYGEGFFNYKVAFFGAIFLEWAGFALCGILIGYLIPKRHLTAAILGASFTTALITVETFTGGYNYWQYIYVAPMFHTNLDVETYDAYRIGIVVGLVARSAVTVVVARFVAQRRLRRIYR